MATASEHPKQKQPLTGMRAVAVSALYGMVKIAGLLVRLAPASPSISIAVWAALACGNIAAWLDS